MSPFTAWLCLLLFVAGVCGVVLCRSPLLQVACGQAAVVGMAAVVGAILDGAERQE